MTTKLDIVLHLDVADSEPGSPATLSEMQDWLVPDIIKAVGRVLGHPGDYATVWADGPLRANYEAIVVDCLHDRVVDGPDEDGLFHCVVCRQHVTADGMVSPS